MQIDIIFKIAAVGIIVTIVCQILTKSDRVDHCARRRYRYGCGSVRFGAQHIRFILTMAELIKIIGVGLVTAVAAVLLRSTKPELSFAVTVAGVVIILIFAIDLASETFGIFSEIGEMAGIDDSLVKIVVKIIAIGYLVEFAAGMVEDFGSKSVADKLVFAGKVIIFTVSVPIVRSMVTLIGNFLEML